MPSVKGMDQPSSTTGRQTEPALQSLEPETQAEGGTRQLPEKRWRVDTWLVFRPGGSTINTTGDRPASYGASQAGAVFGYRLAPNSRHDPTVYLRASKALVAAGEIEGAAGIRVKPLGGVPVNLHAELRAVRGDNSADLRPAVFASGGLSGVRLPFGIEGEGYLQTGYVGGDFATGFVDGRAVVLHKLAKNGDSSFDGGFGVWGGAQRGAARLDVGPSLQAAFKLDDIPVRIAADYRIRVAGGATPETGAAITLSTGF